LIFKTGLDSLEQNASIGYTISASQDQGQLQLTELNLMEGEIVVELF